MASVKRKQPPQIVPRYPVPDPTDPFAPLSVLRDRASTSALDTPTHGFILQHHKVIRSRPTKHILPSSSVNFPTRRDISHVYALPNPLVNASSHTDTSDGGSGSDVEPMVILAIAEADPCPTPRTTAKMAKFFLPSKIRSSLTSIESSGKRLQKHSISPPMNFQHLSSSSMDRAMLQSPPPGRDLRTQESRLSPLRPRVTVHAPRTPCEPEHHPLDPPATASLSTPSPPSSASFPKAFITSSRSMPDNPLTSTSPAPRPTVTHSATTPNLRTLNRRHSHPHHYQNRRISRQNLHGPPPSPSETEWALPTQSQLAYASSLPVIAESGLRVAFGSLFEKQRTIVIFVRHLWCPLCQDYMTSLTSLAHPDIMFLNSKRTPATEMDKCGKQERVQLVVISNGAHTLISKYKQLFGLPFSMYADPSQALYAALGMGVIGERNPGGPSIHAAPSEEKVPSEEKSRIVDGGYVRRGFVSGVTLVVMRAIKIGMPIWENGGDARQLGGEFIFGPGLRCAFAHRMQTTRGHAPVPDVLQAAGVRIPSTRTESSMPSTAITAPKNEENRGGKTRRNSVRESRTGSVRRRQTIDLSTDRSSVAFYMTEEEEADWMMARMRSLDQLKERKNMRRVFGAHCTLSQDGPCTRIEEENKCQLGVGGTSLSGVIEHCENEDVEVERPRYDNVARLSL